MKVAYLSFNPADASSFYRLQGVLPYIEGIEWIDFSDKTDLHPYHFIAIDIFIASRPFTVNHIQIIELAKKMRCKVILDYDDELLLVPVSNPTYSLFNHNKDNIVTCLHLANEIWVTTDAIKMAFSVFNENIHVIPNAHNDYLFPIDEKRPYKQSNKIAYRGATTHEVDLYEHFEELVYTINHSKKWEFRFIGSRFFHLESKTNENHTMTDPLPLMDYFYHLQDYNPNIFFYPLQNTPFNQCKSNCSFLEATYAGAAFIGNDELQEFAQAPIFAINGNLGRVMNIAMNDPQICEGLNHHAWTWILNNRLLSNVNELRKERLVK